MAINLLSCIILALTTYRVFGTEISTIDCGTITAKLESRMSGGEKTDRGQWPFLAALFTVKEEENDFYCGGSLISPRHVLTAAHCIQGKSIAEKLLPRNISVLLGAYNLTSKTEMGVQQRDVQEIYVHPDWDFESEQYDADLAILFLNEVVLFTDYIRPVCIPVNDTDIDDFIGSVVGWGHTENRTKPNTEFIKRAHVTALDGYFCLTKYPEMAVLSSVRTFCGQGEDGNANKGDSGGGFYVRNEESVWVQHGIVSSLRTNSRGLVDADSVVVYTNVAKFKKWIADTVMQSGAEIEPIIAPKNLANSSIELNLECVFGYGVYGKYTCYVDDLDIRSDNFAVASFYGSHLSKKTDEDVEAISFRTGTMLFIPSGVGQFFKNLKKLQIQENLSIQRIKRSDFKSLQNLVVFHIDNNEINNFDYDSLRDLLQLETLALMENTLKEIEERMFETNIKLKRVYLYRNNLKVLPRHLFRNNSLLEIVSLYNNSLRIIDESIFETNIKLKEVYLQDNKIKVLPSRLFQNNLLLKEISLNDNFLEIIDELTFATNINLKKVHLYNNYLEVIPSHLFRNTSLLEIVSVSNNSLEMVDESTFETNINLKKVYLADNKLQVLPRHLFRNNLLLETINMRGNRLKSIDASTFETNSKLKEVYLQANELEVLPRNLFRNNSLLEMVSLRDNHLKTIETKFTSLRNIKQIYLYNNVCIDSYYEGDDPETYRNQFRDLGEFQEEIRVNCRRRGLK